MASKCGNISNKNFICLSFSRIDGVFILLLNPLVTTTKLEGFELFSDWTVELESDSESESVGSITILLRLGTELPEDCPAVKIKIVIKIEF